MLRTLIISAATIGLSGALPSRPEALLGLEPKRSKTMKWAKVILTSTIPAALGLALGLSSGPAQAHCKGKHTGGHEHCIGDPGGDLTFSITLTDSGVEVAAGDGIEGPGGSIDGLTEVGSFDAIALGSISTNSGVSDVQADYNDLCGGVVNMVDALEDIDDIRVVPNPEISELTVVVNYTVGDQSFILLLAGELPEVFPPSVATPPYDLNMWNNRGGGKGKKNRCGTGPEHLDGVTLEIVPTP